MAISVPFLNTERKRVGEVEQLADQMAAAIAADDNASVESLRTAREFRDYQARLRARAMK